MSKAFINEKWHENTNLSHDIWFSEAIENYWSQVFSLVDSILNIKVPIEPQTLVFYLFSSPMKYAQLVHIFLLSAKRAYEMAPFFCSGCPGGYTPSPPLNEYGQN